MTDATSSHSFETSSSDVRPKSRRRIIVLVLVGIVVVPVVLYFALLVFVLQPVRVEGAAMSPTLNNGDRVFIWKRVGSLKRGDIVVFYSPEDQSRSFIKRVIGLPGEAVDLDPEERVTINGEAISEPYVIAERNQTARRRWGWMREEGFKHVGSDSYFVMGDNRDASNDSRTWGPVPRSLIYGKVMSRYWPLGQQPK